MTKVNIVDFGCVGFPKKKSRATIEIDLMSDNTIYFTCEIDKKLRDKRYMWTIKNKNPELWEYYKKYNGTKINKKTYCNILKCCDIMKA